MDQARLDFLASRRGYDKAARKIGAPAMVYRPTAALDPMQGTPWCVLPLLVDSSPRLAFQAPVKWDIPLVTGIGDLRALQSGDLLQHNGATYFFVNRQPYRPAWLALATDMVDIYDTSTPSNHSTWGPRDETQQRVAGDALVARGWPIAIMETARGSEPDARLPSDVRSIAMKCFLPPIPGLTIVAKTFRLRTSSGLWLRIAGAQFSQFGWHIEALEDSV